jgi:hypothetical protein
VCRNLYNQESQWRKNLGLGNNLESSAGTLSLSFLSVSQPLFLCLPLFFYILSCFDPKAKWQPLPSGYSSPSFKKLASMVFPVLLPKSQGKDSDWISSVECPLRTNQLWLEETKLTDFYTALKKLPKEQG